MSQSFANTNSFPLELGLGNQSAGEWALPKVDIRLDNPFKGASRFLRYPGPQDGVGYRAARVGVLLAFRVSSVWIKPVYHQE